MQRNKRGRLWQGIKSSAAFRVLGSYDALNRRFLSGAFGEGMAPARRAELRRSCLLAREGSAFFRTARAIAAFVLRGSVGSCGSFLLLSSLFGILGRIAMAGASVVSLECMILAVLLASAAFLLPSKQSLAYAIENSMLGAWLFFTVCRFPRDRFAVGEERGEERPWLTLLSALFGGAMLSLLHPLLVLGILIGLLLLLLIQAVPELMFMMLLFGLPFLNITGHPTQLLTWLLLVGEGMWLGKLLCGHRIGSFGLLEFFVILFACFLLVGGAFGIGGLQSFFRGGVQTVMLLSYFPLAGLFSQSVWRKRALTALSLSAFLCACMGILQYVTGRAELRWVDLSRFSDIGGRVTSLFDNPNVLGVYLLLSFPMALGEVFDRERSHAMRCFFAASAFASLLCLILTWSRGAWLGAMISVLLFLLLYGRTTRRGMLCAAIPVLIWLPLLPRNMVNRFSSIGTLGESSIRYRMYTWRGTLRMLKSHPFGIGIGENSFFAVYRHFAVSGTESVAHSHHLFLQIALELGVVGLVCFLALLLFFFGTVLKTLLEMPSDSTNRLLSLSGVCAICGALIMGLFDYIWYHCGLFWLFFAILAATVAFATDHHMTKNENGGQGI